MKSKTQKRNEAIARIRHRASELKKSGQTALAEKLEREAIELEVRFKPAVLKDSSKT
jgi:hypothetical protein